MQYEIPDTAVPEPTPPRRARWPLAGAMALDLVIIIGLIVIVVTAVQFAFVGVRASQQGLSFTDIATLDQARLIELIGIDGIFASTLIQNLIFAFIPVLRVKMLRHEPLAEIGLQAPRPLRLVLLGIGLGVVVLVLNAASGALFQSFGIQQNQSAQYPLYQGDYGGQVLFFLVAAVMAPLGEEILFRGYVFNALRLSYGNRRWGVPLAFVVSALLFSLAHSLAATEGIVALLVPTFIMGLILAWGMNRTGSVVPGIIAHAINNGVALIALLACTNNPGMCPTL